VIYNIVLLKWIITLCTKNVLLNNKLWDYIKKTVLRKITIKVVVNILSKLLYRASTELKKELYALSFYLLFYNIYLTKKLLFI